MKAVVQRVAQAQVLVEGVCVGAVERGLLVLIGIAPNDGEEQIALMLRKLMNLRVFPDSEGRMNLSVCDIQGGMLLVPNFTLMADTRRGSRPSFTPAAPPDHAAACFERLIIEARDAGQHIASGRFGADMQVSLVNDGPVTILLDVA